MRLILTALFALFLVDPVLAITCNDPLNKLPFGCTPRTGAASGIAGGSIKNVIADVFNDLATFIDNGIADAETLATSIPDLQDGNGQQCWIAMRKTGAVIKAHPVPLTFSAPADFEALRLLVMSANDLCSNVQCTQVFADGVNIANAAAGGLLTGLPSLNAICSKVPIIARAAPIAQNPPSPSPVPLPPAPPSPLPPIPPAPQVILP
jgi:hypothetical protein